MYRHSDKRLSPTQKRQQQTAARRKLYTAYLPRRYTYAPSDAEKKLVLAASAATPLIVGLLLGPALMIVVRRTSLKSTRHWVPIIYPGARNWSMATILDATGSLEEQVVTFETSDRQEAAWQFYKANLEEEGWQCSYQSNGPVVIHCMQFGDTDRVIDLGVQQSRPGSTSVEITYTEGTFTP